MDWDLAWQIFGYIGSALVVFSLTRTNVKHLWSINAAGCVVAIIFCLKMKNYPMAIMNSGCLIIDIVQVINYVKKQKAVVPSAEGDAVKE